MSSTRTPLALRWTVGPALPDDAPGNLLEPVLRQAARTPERVAVENAGEAWSYAYLVHRAEALARALSAALAAPVANAEAPVAVLLEREAALPAVLLGVMAAGLPYLPLDPAYPRERLAYMVRDSGARAVLTREDLARRLEVRTWKAGAPVVVLEKLTGTGEDVAPPERPGTRADGQRLAYLLYTSGSTGRPKGVAVEHRSGAALLAWARRALPAELARAMVFATSVSFDVSVFELFWPLAVGGRVVLVNNALALAHEPAARSATFLSTSPSLLAELLRQGKLPRSVRGIGLAGEALPRDLAARVRGLGTVETLYNLYGPSEDTTFSTWHRVFGPPASPEAPGDGGGAGPSGSASEAAPPIGYPLDGTRLLVLDAHGRPCPPGEPGELHLAGAGLARGYHRRPGLTAERFVPAPDPEPAEPGARMFRTGDLVRQLPEGELAFLGRLDQQIKLRGLRIELGEIEVALRACPGVAEAAVALEDAGAGSKAAAEPRLVAFLVPEERLPSRRDLLARLRAWLPAHMVPSAFLALPALPRTPSGKLDRRALSRYLRSEPHSQLREGEAEEELIPAWLADDLAELVAGLWAEVLHGDPRGDGTENEAGAGSPPLDLTFLEAGGTSLLAARLALRLRESVGRQVDPVELLDDLTLNALIERLRAPEAEAELGMVEGAAALAPTPGSTAGGRDPLNHSQLRLWFLERMGGDSEAGFTATSPALHLPARYLVEGDVPPARLRGALAVAVERHESLRTRFGFDPAASGPGGGAHARVEPPFRPALPMVDLSSLPAAVAGVEAEHLQRREAARPFRLDRLPLFRACLLRLAPGRALLLLTAHHIIVDGWSLSLLGDELARHAADTPSASAPPPPPLRPADFASWQQELLASPWRERELAFWRARLEGAPRQLDLPTDRPRQHRAGHAGHGAGPETTARPGDARPGGTVSIRLGGALGERLRALARRRRVTPFMLLLAALDALLSRATGQNDLVVGTYAAGRARPQLAPLVGYFVNDLALRVDTSGDPTFGELLRRVRRSTLEAQAHQELPHDLVAREVGRQERGSLFRVMLNLQSFRDRFSAGEGREPRLTLLHLPETYWAHHELAFWLHETGGRVEGTLVYDRALFDPTTVHRWRDHLLSLLASLPLQADEPISHLPLLGPAGEHQVLLEWGQGEPIADLAATGAARRDGDEPVLTAILRQARTRPDAVALVTGEARLTYAALLGEAGEVARRLRARGIGADDRVGIWGDRDPAMIPALLGILIAGAAYQPVDPLQPPERVVWMLADSGARAFLVPRGLPAAAWGDFAGPVLRLEEGKGGDGPRAALPALPPIDRGNAAYVIYTSGSTGRPKGVVLSHHNLATYTETAARAFRITAQDRVLQFNSLGFDASVEEIFPTLVRGATLVLRDDEMAASPAVFGERLHAWRITVVDLPTAYWHLWALHLAEREEAEPLPACLRIVIIAGERALPERYAGWVRATGLRPRLINTYGPTEATIVGTSWEAASPAEAAAIGPATEAADEAVQGRDVPIGRPIRGAAAVVLSTGLRAQPPGFPGELFLGGEGVARGYLGRPALTAERFVPAPSASVAVAAGPPPGARLYRTGDLVRLRADGLLDFLGRADEQVKVRGFRVELGEIEAVLRGHPALRDAVVLARPGAAGEKGRHGAGDGTRLVAYLVPSGRDDSQLVRELRASVARALPSYMVPAAFVVLAEMPLNPAGKVDRKALAAIDPDTRAPAAGDAPSAAAPATEIEEILLVLWEELLGTRPIGVHDDFFALGGHSLLVPQLLARIATAFEIELPVRVLFEAPTITTLARVLEDALLAELEEMSDEEIEAAMEE